MAGQLGKMIRMPKPDEILDPADWYGRTNFSAEDWQKLWGVPDWRDEKAYPEKVPQKSESSRSHAGLSQDQWRWEFLRRDSDYREDYEACCKGLLPYWVCKGIDPNVEIRKPQRKGQQQKGPPLHYDMLCMVDPRVPAHAMPRQIFMRRHEGAQITAGSYVDTAELSQNPRYGLFVFDAHRPLTEQLERAQSQLVKLQNQAAAAQRDKARSKGRTAHRRGKAGANEVIKNNRVTDDYRHMLRLIDAVMEQTPIKEIGRLLYRTSDYSAAQTKLNKDMRKAVHIWEWL